MRTCLVLIRDPERTYDKADAERSEVLYEEVVRPVAEEFGFVCERVDPHEYGIRDSRLFNLTILSRFLLTYVGI